jgi:teichuronic acid biosynthesis glycosyltransferase TuaH
MAERLTELAPVLYVDPPVSRWSHRRDRDAAEALRGPRLRPVQPRLARLTPVVLPGRSRPGMRAVTGALTRRAMRRAVRSLGGSVDVVVAATLLPVLDTWPDARRVLYATDDFAAGAELMGIDPAWVQARQQAALAEADTVVVVSEHLASKWRTDTVHPVVIDNGVDVELFASTDDVAPATDVRLPRPIAGFVGHLSDRIDVELLEAVAARGCSLLLVGPRQQTFEFTRVEGLLARPNVQWTGPRAFEELPAYLRTVQVGLLPYVDSEFNRSSSPLKVLEYLAAGRAAVATDLPAVRQLGEVVHVASTPATFADAVERALAAAPDAAEAARRRAAAEARSWSRQAAAFARAIGLPVPARPHPDR